MKRIIIHDSARLDGHGLRESAVARNDAGQSLLETAILVPFLLLLTIGLIDIGKYSYAAVAVGNSARAGAEYGSQNLTTALDYTGMATAAANDAGSISGFSASASSMCVCANGAASTCLPTDCASSHRLTYVSVTSTATVNAFIKYPGLPQQLAVHRTMVMQVSQ